MTGEKNTEETAEATSLKAILQQEKELLAVVNAVWEDAERWAVHPDPAVRLQAGTHYLTVAHELTRRAKALSAKYAIAQAQEAAKNGKSLHFGNC